MKEREDAVWALSPYKNLTHKMLNAGPQNRDLRKYVVEQVKAPLMNAIIKYGQGRRPQLLSPNGQVLAEIGERFLEYDGQIGVRKAMFVAGLDALLGCYENPDDVDIPKPITVFSLRYPKPTKENTDLANTHILLDVRDEFLSLYPELDTIKVRAIFRLLICQYHHDSYYRWRMDYWVEKLAWHVLMGEWEDRDTWIDWLIKRLIYYVEIGYWKPRAPHRQEYLWNEPVLADFWGNSRLKDKIKPYKSEDERVMV